MGRAVSSLNSKRILKSLRIEKIAAFAKIGFAEIIESQGFLLFFLKSGQKRFFAKIRPTGPDLRQEPLLPGFQKVRQNLPGLRKEHHNPLRVEKIAAFAKIGFAEIAQSFANLVLSAEPDFRKEPFLPGFQKV